MIKLTKREYFALEMAKASVTSSAAISLSSEQVALNAVKDADALLAELEKTTSNGWTKYDGGIMPCSPSLTIRVKYRCGEESSEDRADYYLWNQTGEAYDIMEWREA